MDIQLTEEQELLCASVQRLLRDQYDFDARRRIVATDDGWSRKHWNAFAELGLCAAPFRERSGGLGGGPLATMIVMQEFGRKLVVEPFFETVVLAGGLIEEFGSPALRDAHLPQIMAGETIWTLAWAEARSRFDFNHVTTTAQRHGADIGRPPRSQRREPLRGRSTIREFASAELQGDRWPSRRRNHVDECSGSGRPVAGHGRRGRRRAGGVP
jgi:alkylation response protein AidB-like acyl-CoA dehydrogenase